MELYWYGIKNVFRSYGMFLFMPFKSLTAGVPWPLFPFVLVDLYYFCLLWQRVLFCLSTVSFGISWRIFQKSGTRRFYFHFHIRYQEVFSTWPHLFLSRSNEVTKAKYSLMEKINDLNSLESLVNYNFSHPKAHTGSVSYNLILKTIIKLLPTQSGNKLKNYSTYLYVSASLRRILVFKGFSL